MSRITKVKIIGYLNWMFIGLVKKNQFKWGHGTSQLGAKTKREQELVARSVEYGRALAFEQISRMLNENDALIADFDTITSQPACYNTKNAEVKS